MMTDTSEERRAWGSPAPTVMVQCGLEESSLPVCWQCCRFTLRTTHDVIASVSALSLLSRVILIFLFFSLRTLQQEPSRGRESQGGCPCVPLAPLETAFHSVGKAPRQSLGDARHRSDGRCPQPVSSNRLERALLPSSGLRRVCTLRGQAHVQQMRT